MNIANQRLFTQRLLSQPFKSPEEAVRWFGAVQAQEYMPSLWAIGLRMSTGTTEEIIKQAIQNRKIVRTWPMRGTIHFVPADDTKWMVTLLADRVNRKFLPFLNKIDLTEPVLNTCRDILIHSLEGGKQLTRKELYADLARGGIKDTNKRGVHIIGYLAQAGLLCFGPYREKQPTFTLLDEWVPTPRVLEGDDALAEITKRYFTSHGPATVHDFAWWSGLSITEARKGLELVRSGFISEEQDGKEYWFPHLTDMPSIQDSALLLPCFDEYTVAYKDRSAAVSNDMLKELGYGVNSNNIIMNGRIAGTWKRIIKKNEVIIELYPIQPFTPEQQKLIDHKASEFGTFTGLAETIRIIS